MSSPESHPQPTPLDSLLASKRPWLAQAHETLARAARLKRGGGLESLDGELVEFFSAAYALAQTRVDLARVDVERERVVGLVTGTNAEHHLSKIVTDGRDSSDRRAAARRVTNAEPPSTGEFVSRAEPLVGTTLAHLKNIKPRSQEAELLAADTMLVELTNGAYARAATRADIVAADALSRRVDIALEDSEGAAGQLLSPWFRNVEGRMERMRALRAIIKAEPKETRAFLNTNDTLRNDLLQILRTASKPSQEETRAQLAGAETMLRLLLQGAYDRAQTEADVDLAEAFRASIAEALTELPAKTRAFVHVDYFSVSNRRGERTSALRRIKRAKTNDAR